MPVCLVHDVNIIIVYFASFKIIVQVFILIKMPQKNMFAIYMYCIYPKYWCREELANNVDTDQITHSVASDQDLHCFQLIQQFLDT